MAAETFLYELLRNRGSLKYDVCLGFIVRARSAREARHLAAEAVPVTEEGPDWLNPRRTSCRRLRAQGKPEVVMVEFQAG